jgi:hypothetical protein
MATNDALLASSSDLIELAEPALEQISGGLFHDPPGWWKRFMDIRKGAKQPAQPSFPPCPRGRVCIAGTR